jgi:predicted Zn-dependent protease
MMKLRSIALALLVAYPMGAVQSAQAVQSIELPDLGEVSRAALSESSEDRVGREIMQQIRDDVEYLDDPVLLEYLNALGDRLAAASADPARHFDFFIVRDRSINAFALPGGHIGVHTGLISITRNESELASVLAHEIGHVTQKHIARMVDSQKSAGLATLLALAVAILAARSNSQVSEAAIVGSQAANIQNQLNFTRENEREADRAGFQTLVAADFSAQGMATFFERLQAESRVSETNAPAYLRTHPITFQRIADIQDRLSSVPYRQVKDGDEFAFVRARVQASEGEAQEAVSRFEIMVAEQPTPAAWYGLAQASMRTGNTVRAEQALDAIPGAARNGGVSAPLMAVARCELALARKQPAEAVRVSAAALAHQSAYRPLAYLHVRALLSANQPRQALDFLSERQRIWSSDGRLYALQSEAYQALGQSAQAHLAQAESYVLADRTGAAIEQLQLAQRAGKADFYTLSIIDARLRNLRERQQKEAPR